VGEGKVPQIDPGSIRAKLVVRFWQVIDAFHDHRQEMAAMATQQKLTRDELLAALLTESALEILGLDGDEVP
jgi:hypothetical protein